MLFMPTPTPHPHTHQTAIFTASLLGFSVLYPLNFDFIVEEFVDVSDDGRLLDVEDDKRWDDATAKEQQTCCRH